MKTLITFVCALVLVCASAFAQQADSSRFEEMRQSMLLVEGGKVVNADIQSQAAGSRMQPRGHGSIPNGVKVFVWTDKKVYVPGEEIKVRALGLAPDAERLTFNVSETFYDDAGKQITSDSYPCECGDGNGGYVPSLTGFTFITLTSKKVLPTRVGRYDFHVFVSKSDGFGGRPMFYQNILVTAYAMSSSRQEPAPIVIDQMIQVPYMGRTAHYLVGQFPVNEPMFFFVGAPPFYGGFTQYPSAVSTDGRTLILPVVIGGTRIEGRVVLMTGDGRYSTTTPHTFVPQIPQVNSAGSTQPVPKP